MNNQIVRVPFSQTLDLDILRSRISKLRDTQRSSDDVSGLSPSDLEKLLKDCAFPLQSNINQCLSEFSHISSLPVEELDEYLEHLRAELWSVDAENAEILDKIEGLMRTSEEDSNWLESELEELNCSLDFVASQDHDKAKADESADCLKCGDDQLKLLDAHGDSNFKILELSQQIEENEVTLKSLQDFDCIFKRFEAIDKIEDTLTGLKVIEFDGTHIRLSMRTYFPNIESILRQQKIEEIIAPLEQNHELLIEVVEGTMELKNVEIFPNDVYIGEAIDAAKSFRQRFSLLPVLDTGYFFKWFGRRVQDRICLCALRRFVVKSANKSRHSFDYVDRDEIIIAHTVGGVDAFIKMSQDWPIHNSALKLLSLKSSNPYSKEISLSFLCKVEEVANSLDTHIRQNVCSFVDAIEEILMQQRRAELQSGSNSEK